MIRKLKENDIRLVLDFVYLRERENLFVIGAFDIYKKPFESNCFYGFFENDRLLGLATFFKRWGSFVVSAHDPEVIKTLTDYAVREGNTIEFVPCFKEYADVIVERLETVHRIKPKIVSQQTVFILDLAHFHDFSTGQEITPFEEDVDEIVLFERSIHGRNLGKPIQKIERERINLRETFILKVDGKIVSKANVQGTSKQYFQIGGVGTAQEYRGKGYAKRVVSKLCRHFFDQGLPYALLFTDDENVAAQKVYEAIGFRPDGKFVVARY